ncbi:hypothetical protein COX86_02625 [Candidatus Micrarchaeota archaeon CG_4_10_14_0_2_um_filter_60_11]|nr:MAG: hypothetical protein AUJ16_00440 [Candidatus Micrarchaeota archaeon CG1_02_60_51]PIN96256.1 MAG: hypothetical protein COU39_02025 [Candidatus Micrarchaeota archaeon CG10_big_fil_rev_8_21_14_0_10_60_32]PIO02157.1 MAG: hypothetical protein COT58_01495 [Candidatus Micrarchaeota archaeon CG09_land_8_20_14_0_10_60_16]PIY91368.1 MAG: hypothetical protein COY71_03545 [Candidatus Micrarchaeota archaeon CG_4_10_14_0_8_um_filter_60_7]PIZ90903.1 MAG: hypothetical protein COX86_02625 [Candidatus Mi
MPEKGEVITYQFTRRESGWNRLSKRRKRAILDAYNTVSRTFAPELSDSEHKANVKRWLGTTLFPSAMRSKRLREELGIPDDSGGGYKKFPELRSYIIALRNISRETVEPVHEVTHAFFGEKNLELNSFHKALASAMHWIYWTRDWKAVKFPKITKFDIDNKTILALPEALPEITPKKSPKQIVCAYHLGKRLASYGLRIREKYGLPAAYRYLYHLSRGKSTLQAEEAVIREFAAPKKVERDLAKAKASYVGKLSIKGLLENQKEICFDPMLRQRFSTERL